MTRWIATCTLATLLCVAGSVSPVEADDFSKALEHYKERKARPSLKFRTQGRIRLAASRDPRAIAVLEKDYAKPEKPTDEVRWLTASIAPYYCDQDEHVDAFEGWRSRHAKLQDAWLWHETLRVHAKWRSTKEFVELLSSEHDLRLRLAGIEAMATERSFGLFDLTRAAFDLVPAKAGEERWQWMATIASALHGMYTAPNKARASKDVIS